MGRCVTCREKDASYCPAGGGPRRWCFGCSGEHEGAVPKYQSQPQKRPRKTRKRPSDQRVLPLSLAALPRQPRIVASLGVGWMEERVTTEELIANAPRGTWTPNTSAALDLTTHTGLAARAAQLGAELCGEDYAPMAAMQRDIARAMHVNETACFGMNRSGNHTERHQHSPMGVLQLLGGQRAEKMWRFWPPETEGDETEPMMLRQRAGDVLYFPPGWFHEVYTLAGDLVETTVSHDVVAPNWVSWCLPRHLALEGGFALAVNAASEAQVTGTPSAKEKRAIYDAIVRYVRVGDV